MKKNISQRLQKLDKDLEKLFQDLSAYSNETLNRPPAPGKWSALQVMHHLLMAEGYAQRYVKKKLSFNPRLKKAGLGAQWRSFLLWLYLTAPFKFKAPPAVTGENLPAQTSLEETKTLWLQQRRELQDLFESFPDELFSKSIYKHPFAGRLSLKGMLLFFQTHFNRHRKQIERTLKIVENKSDLQSDAAEAPVQS